MIKSLLGYFKKPMELPAEEPQETLEEHTKVEVTFHFVSGKELTVTYKKSWLNELNESLTKHWDGTTWTGDQAGIQFQHVTHYIVKKI